MAISWTSILSCTERGPRPTLANAVTVLQKDPLWSGRVFWYDEFLDRILIQPQQGAPRQWTDEDDTRVAIYLQHEIQMFSIGESVVSSAIRYVASQRPRHVVRDYLDTLTWDRQERIAGAFTRYWGAAGSATQPNDYIRAISENFFLGMVARVRQPGCQLDTMVIFEAIQGLGKARALRALGGDWYMVAAESVTSKDFFQSLPGAWLVEIGEMDAFSRAERERVKMAISTPTDRYRRSYGRRAQDVPRQGVFAGTTNRQDYGQDDTGLRRFLPIWCDKIDVDALAADRDQLFAEADAKFKTGARWWITPDSSTQQAQRERQFEDVWTDPVLEWVVGQPEVTTNEVLAGALKVRPADMDRGAQMRVGSILRLAGWERKTVRRDGKLKKAYVRPDVLESGEAEF